MEHPITPPPELVQMWKRTAPHRVNETEHYHYITLCAAQWGADQELEACREWAKQFNYDDECYEDKLRAARRPKPPSLKEQALAELEGLRGDAYSMGMGFDAPAIRRALEALPND
jgi:hypothetical protein